MPKAQKGNDDDKSWYWGEYKEELVKRVIRDRANLPDNAVSVCFCLVCFLNKHTYLTYPSIKLIMKETQLSKSAVQRALKKLKERGHIELVKKGKLGEPGFSNRSNQYTPTFRPPIKATLGSRKRNGTGSDKAQSGFGSDPLEVSDPTPKPYNEPQNKPKPEEFNDYYFKKRKKPVLLGDVVREHFNKIK